jgi:plasmid stabilization system protein ParE
VSSSTDAEFDSLPADAAEVRQDLVERMGPRIRRIQAEHPEMGVPDTDAPRRGRFVTESTAAAVWELYNPAQVDVMRRVRDLLMTG